MNTPPTATHPRSPLTGISIVVLVLLVFGLLAYFPGQLRNARLASATTQLQLEENTRKTEQLESEITRLEHDLNTLRQKTDGEKIQLNRLLTTEKTAALNLHTQIESMKTDATQQQARFDAANLRIRDLEADLADRMELIGRLGREARDARDALATARQEAEARQSEMQGRLNTVQRELTQLRQQAEEQRATRKR
jgi:chromosome segregation ATPase